jgi:polyphosphate glucokinase
LTGVVGGNQLPHGILIKSPLLVEFEARFGESEKGTVVVAMPEVAMPEVASCKTGSCHTLAVDIGGTAIKTLLLDERGKPVSDRMRVKTPQPATPNAVVRTIVKSAEHHGSFDRVSVGFPGVVRSNGTTETAHNLHPRWVGFDLAKALSDKLGKSVRVANDADIQGFGAIAGLGVELVLTLGTGVGSALFINGTLVPNLELGHHPFRKGQTYEEQLGKIALEKTGKKKWNHRLGLAIRQLEKLFNYDHLYLGGGHSLKISIKLPDNAKIVSNVAGLLGGIALWQGERWPEHKEGHSGVVTSWKEGEKSPVLTG